MVQQENQPLAILIVDDVQINQNILSITLQKLGYQPDVAGSGPEAIEKAETKKYDLIFMDIHMPEMDGMETTTLIRGLERAGGTSHSLRHSPPMIRMTCVGMQNCWDGSFRYKANKERAAALSY